MNYKYSAINKLFCNFVTLIYDLFFHPICLNACLHYSWGKLAHRNWGDDINQLFIEKLFKRKISYLYTSSLAIRHHTTNYLMIGSTIDQLCNEQTIIWGAGVIDKNSTLPAKPQNILAVRGPLTRQYLLDRGCEVPPIYGDPALLLKYWYQPKVEKRYKLGIIPHYSDYNHPALDSLKSNTDVLIIKMEGYKNWLRVIDLIYSCEFIASSSLHGLIIAETYNIPNLWIELSGQLLGGHFKFHDFFLSMNCDRPHPFVLTQKMNISHIIAEMEHYQKGEIDLNPLIDAAPFNIYLRKTN